MAAPLADALRHPALWRGDDHARGIDTVPSGFDALDHWLPGGGWPRGTLTEIAHAREGIGELRLIAPAAARLTREGLRVVFIAPPHIPYAPALAAAGFDLRQLLLVRAQSMPDRLWALAQALRSKGCGAVLAWPGIADERSLRRLQLACAQGNTCGFLFVPERALVNASPAALRLRLAPAETGGLEARIVKRRGSLVPVPVMLDSASVAGKDIRGSCGSGLARDQRHRETAALQRRS